MGYFVSMEQADEIMEKLSGSYKIYAPVLRQGRGRGGRKDEVRYGVVQSASGIVYDRKSDYSPKEALYPVVQTLLYFKGAECEESEPADGRKILIFARACDINAFLRLDEVFLRNGGQADVYYARLRERAKFVMMECVDGFETCFCVSMGTNRTNDYDAAVRFTPDGLLFEVRDSGLAEYFQGMSMQEFTPQFVAKNERQVTVPEIPDRSYLPDICGLEYWRQFDEKCIACGGCNTVCPSCSCFDTNDILYNETSTDGERRRSWSGCMLESYTVMAGGHGVRAKHGDNMRFKTLHKVYDFNERFGIGHMCVGCGRCDMRCPRDISFSETISGLAGEVLRLKEERAEGGAEK